MNSMSHTDKSLALRNTGPLFVFYFKELLYRLLHSDVLLLHVSAESQIFDIGIRCHDKQKRKKKKDIFKEQPCTGVI